MPTPRNHPAIGVVNGRLYLIGGRITANNIGGYVAANVDVVEEYNPATDSWRAMNRMPSRPQRPGLDDVSGEDLRGWRRAARLSHRRRAA
jgi:N-acetylneuraminic acid mutarotase